jgi:hypothetical protein
MLAKDIVWLATDEDFTAFLAAFRDGTLPHAEFNHAAHVAVAAALAFEHQPEEAFARTKSTILAYNAAVGTRNTETGGYHETLTRFWSEVIGGFLRGGRFASRLDAVRAAVDAFGHRRDLHREYYSFDVVADRRARREWVAPDRRR